MHNCRVGRDCVLAGQVQGRARRRAVLHWCVLGISCVANPNACTFSLACCLLVFLVFLRAEVFTAVDCKVEWLLKEGAVVDPSTAASGKVVVAKVTGKCRNILLGERTALNILTRASGIATQVLNACVPPVNRICAHTVCCCCNLLRPRRRWTLHAASAGTATSPARARLRRASASSKSMRCSSPARARTATTSRRWSCSKVRTQARKPCVLCVPQCSICLCARVVVVCT